MSFTKADALTRIYPFLIRLVLPQGVIDYEKNIPATDVTIIVTTNNVLVRKEIHPALIALLAQTIVEAHDETGTFPADRRIPHTDRRGISGLSRRYRFLQERSSIPKQVFALLDSPPRSEIIRCVVGGRRNHLSVIQFCAQAASVVFERPYE